MSKQIEIVKKYVSLVQNLDFSESTTAELLHEDYLQWELPNLLNKLGQKSDATDSFKRMQTAKMILSSQSYEITSTLEQGNTVVIETIWTATMAIDAGPLKKGQAMKAYFCMFFEFKDGKIHRVRNYDCFEPLA
jgi:ketosteroid isomerase-like protein